MGGGRHGRWEGVWRCVVGWWESGAKGRRRVKRMGWAHFCSKRGWMKDGASGSGKVLASARVSFHTADEQLGLHLALTDTESSVRVTWVSNSSSVAVSPHATLVFLGVFCIPARAGSIEIPSEKAPKSVPNPSPTDFL